MENRVIRIAHFPGSLKFGGVGSVVMNLYRNVDRNKIQFDFYVSRNEKGPFDDEVSELGGRIFYVPKIRSVGPFKYIKFIKDALMENGPYDVVHVHSAHTGVFSLISAKKAGIKNRIFHVHSTSDAAVEGLPFKRLIILWLNRLIKNNATINLACSKEAGAYVFKKRPFVVLNNGISLKQFNKSVGVAQDVEKMIPMNKIVIGNVARFVPLKNQKFLIDLAAFDKTKQNCCFFIFVGDGQTLDGLKSKALENKLDNVLFLGERSDTNRIYGLFDIFCLPSLFEGLPLTVIEAQAYGLPCLVSLNVTTEADLHINDYLQINTNDVSDCYDTLLNLDIHKNILQENINNQFSYYMYDVQTVAGKLEDIYINAVRTDAKNENS